MQCPNCGFNADNQDTFCSNCGIIFADYQILKSRQAQKQTISQEQTVQKVEVDPVQQQLATVYLCNSEIHKPVANNSLTTESVTNTAAKQTLSNQDLPKKKNHLLLIFSITSIAIIGIFAAYYLLI